MQTISKKRTLLLKGKSLEPFHSKAKIKTYCLPNCAIIPNKTFLRRLLTKFNRTQVPISTLKLNDKAWAIFTNSELDGAEIAAHYALLNVKPDESSPDSVIQWMVKNKAGCILANKVQITKLRRAHLRQGGKKTLRIFKIKENFHIGFLNSSLDPFILRNLTEATKKHFLTQSIVRTQHFAVFNKITSKQIEQFLKSIHFSKKFELNDSETPDFSVLSIGT